jgi:hypothetical protein
MFRFQKLVEMITPDFYFVKRFFMGPFAAQVQRVQRVQRVVAAYIMAPKGAVPRQRNGQPAKRKALLWAG